MIKRIWGKLIAKNELVRGGRKMKILEVDLGTQYSLKITDWQFGDSEYISDVCEIGIEMYFEFDEHESKLINKFTKKPFVNRDIKKIYPKDSIPDDSWNQSQKFIKENIENKPVNNKVEESILALVGKFSEDIEITKNLVSQDFDAILQKFDMITEQQSIMGNRINKIMEHLKIQEDEYKSAADIYE